MQDGVGLLQELRSLERQQIRIARPGTDDMGDTERPVRPARGVELGQGDTARAGLVTAQRQPGRRALDQPPPEGAALAGLDQCIGLDAEGLG